MDHITSGQVPGLALMFTERVGVAVRSTGAPQNAIVDDFLLSDVSWSFCLAVGS